VDSGFAQEDDLLQFMVTPAGLVELDNFLKKAGH
jgi:hypothetical protein